MISKDKIKWMKIIDYNLGYYNIDIKEIMGKAGGNISKTVVKKYGKGKRILILCGKGNNGGDGFAAAYYLARDNDVSIILFGNASEIHTKESRYYWKNIPNNAKKLIINERGRFNDILKNKFDIIIDCILGLGVKGKLEGLINDVIGVVNKVNAKKVAVDVPTPGFKSDLIISLHVKKHPKGMVVDIGIPHKIDFYTGPGNLRILNKRREDSHKGDNGRVLVVAGSKKYHGAGFFAGLAASKFVDLVYFSSVKENMQIAKCYSLEFIVLPLEESIKQIKNVDCCIIGPGLDINNENKNMVEKLIEYRDKRFVLDASVFHLLEPSKLHKNCCITPHAKEFRDFFKVKPNENNVMKLAKRYNCTIVLKGKIDLISNGGELWKNFSGNEGMTTGGTGDILVGVIGGLAGKNDLFEAALAGCFLVGFSGDMLKEKKGLVYNASDLLEIIPLARKKVEEWFIVRNL